MIIKIKKKNNDRTDSTKKINYLKIEKMKSYVK